MRIVASMLAIAIAICFSFSSMGCGTPADKKSPTAKSPTGGSDETKKDVTFDKGEVTVKGDKTKDVVETVSLKTGKAKKVEGAKAPLEAEIKDGKVQLTIKKDTAKADSEVELTVTAEAEGGKEGKFKVKITKQAD
jgi:hypothetical protein